jgi:uncharacterized protein (TIGR03437 family)
MKTDFWSNSAARIVPGWWLAVGLLLSGAGPVQAQTLGPPITLSSVQAVAGEAKQLDWPAEAARVVSIVSVRSTPELAYPFRVDLGINGNGPMRLTVPPATPPGNYEIEITPRADDGRTLSAKLRLTVGSVVVSKSLTGNPPIILLNGWQIFCGADTGSTLMDSTSTFGPMASLLEASASVLFFNNCAYNDPTIEQLAGQLSVYIAGLTYTDGTPVTQVDLVAHSMGGLIARAHLAGLQANGSLSPPANPGVRKFVEIATPNFGSFLAANGSLLAAAGTQSSEMIPGSAFLWNLATWNQRGDDLRGVDALAIIGNAGNWSSSLLSSDVPNASDGVVSLTSASLGFARDPSSTIILPYCHVGPDSPAYALIPCTGTGIAEALETANIVLSFLGGTTSWQTMGTMPSANYYLSQYGGMYFAYVNASDTFLHDLTEVSFGSVALQNGGASDTVYYNEFVSGSGSFQFQSTSAGSFTYGPFSLPAGYFSVFRSKSSPLISSVSPFLAGASGLVVQSGSTITISGVGFGQTRCSAPTCQVLAYPGPVTLAISSWSDTAISAFLPSSFNGFAVILVQTASGQDYINIMAAPAPSLLTIQTNPPGLQFSLDGGSLQTAPQTFSLITGSTHTITVATSQPGATGTQYVFTRWSDGGAASHSFPVNASETLTASFETQYQLTISPSPSLGGSVSPASGGFYDAATVVNLTATANNDYSFSGWTGAVANASATSTTVAMNSAETVTANFKATIAPTTPTINPGGVVPLYSSNPVIQPGSWISIYGSNLANTTTNWNGDFPISLGGVSVTIDNKPGYLYLASPGQINLQAPDDTAMGVVPVVVTTPNGTVTSSVTLAQFGPSFSLANSRYAAGVILTPNGSGAYDGGVYDLLGPTGAFTYNTRPVKAGETLELYGVGFGPTNPPVLAGGAFSGSAPTAQTVTVTIGGVSATVQYSGLTSAALYQLNVVVPNVGSGDQLLQASVGGVLTPGGVYVTLQ